MMALGVPRMRLCFFAPLLLVSACAGRYRTELVGTGTAAVQPRAAIEPGDQVPAATPPVGAEVAHAAPSTLPVGSIQLARGSYDLTLRFQLPSAQVIEWNVQCPGATVEGSLGETFAQYRERRLAQLRADRERQRRNVAAATGTLLGAVAPTIHAEGYASGPGGAVAADATVSGQAVGHAAGEAIANATVDDVIELPPGDVGGGRLQTKVRVTTDADGACVVTAIADEPTVIASFEVTRQRDLDAEARLRVMAANSQARQVRGQLSSQLIGFGADATLRQRRLEAEAQARYEAELADARARAEVAAQLEVRRNEEYAIEVRRRELALRARAELTIYLTTQCGADPGRRARLHAERRAREEARAYELRVELERRRAYEAELAAQRARRVELALGVRADLVAYLVARGARVRPAMPAPMAEDPGAAPFSGAVWIAGRWTWTGVEWQWNAGGWRDSTRFGTAGGAGGVIGVVGGGGAVVIDAGADLTVPVPVIDVTPAATGGPVIRDHRTAVPPPPPPPPVRPAGPVVRDHRTASPPAPPPPVQPAGPVVRDHRHKQSNDNDKNKEKDKGPTVRDHRTR
jgi:hypothetical protein